MKPTNHLRQFYPLEKVGTNRETGNYIWENVKTPVLQQFWQAENNDDPSPDEYTDMYGEWRDVEEVFE